MMQPVVLALILLLLLPVLAQAQAVTAGLTGCWHLDETGVFTGADCTPGGTHACGTVNDTTWQSAASGNCKLNGCLGTSTATPDQHCGIGAPLTAFGTAGNVTVLASFKGTGTPVNGTAAYDLPGIWRDGNAFLGLHWGTLNGGPLSLVAYSFDTDERRVVAPYTMGTQVRVAWVHTGGNLRLYVNGAEVPDSPKPAPPTDSGAGDLELLSAALSQSCTTLCTIDEVYIYNRGLTPAEIATDAGLVSSVPGSRHRILTFD